MSTPTPNAPDSSPDSPAGPLVCPSCGKPMSPVSHDAITFDRCDACGGLWFDLLEHRHLRDEDPRVDEIDVKPAAPMPPADVQLHAPPRTCPRCHAQMTRLKDVDRRDVIYDYCSVCNGTFFDAGEFKRYATKGFVARLIGRIHL